MKTLSELKSIAEKATTISVLADPEDWRPFEQAFTPTLCLALIRDLERCREALEKCHEELVGEIGHEGGDLESALVIADKSLASLEVGR